MNYSNIAAQHSYNQSQNQDHVGDSWKFGIDQSTANYPGFDPYSYNNLPDQVKGQQSLSYDQSQSQYYGGDSWKINVDQSNANSRGIDMSTYYPSPAPVIGRRRSIGDRVEPSWSPERINLGATMSRIVDSLTQAADRAKDGKSVPDRITQYQEIDYPLNKLIRSLITSEKKAIESGFATREDELQEQHTAAVVKLTEKLERDSTTYESEIDRNKKLVSELKGEMEDLKRKHEAEVQSMMQSFKHRESSLSAQHALDLEKTRQNEANLNHDIALMKRDHRAELERQENSYRTRLENQARQNQDALRRSEQESAAKLRETEGRHKREVYTINEKREREILRLQNQITTITETAQSNEIELKKRHEYQMTKIEKSTETRLTDLKERVKRENSKIAHRHQVELSKWMQMVESYRQKSSIRDHFQGLADNQVSTKFGNLAGEVDYISRIYWDAERRDTWPYPDCILRASDNVRKLKQHIILDSIWNILVRAIFSTPFEVFGDEGQALLQEWISEFGQGWSSLFLLPTYSSLKP